MMRRHEKASDSWRAPVIGALVVTWNRKDDALECVDSLLRSEYPRLTVYVVDNASTDGSSQAVAERYPDIRIIRSEENLGFAGGNNLGLARMLDDGVEAAFLINDDAVVERDTFAGLVSGGYDDPTVGVLAPKVLVHSKPGVIWSAGGNIDPMTGISAQRHCGEHDDGQADEPSEIDYAVGCAMLVRAEAIREVGMMDTRYFMYYEEVDWCRRIREAGYRILYVPRSRVTHKVSLNDGGRNRAAYYFARNRLLYLKSAGMPGGKITWLAVSDILRSAAAHAVKGRTDESRLMIKGLVDYYSHSFGKLEEKQ
jgi:hypothetical protein